MVTNLQPNSTEVAFKATYPIDFHLYNHNEENVLFLDNNPIEALETVIQNCSGKVIQFDKPTNDIVGSENYHFTLTFRPGMLFATDLEISLIQSNGWDVSAAQDSTNKTICWYFLKTKGFTLKPNVTVSLSVQNFKVDGGSGSRTTRVLLEYGKLKNVHYQNNNDEHLTGSRKRHLSIINHRGQKNIPLHVGFVGSNTILNDGATPNSLTLRLSNLLPLNSLEPDRSTIPLSVETIAQSKFIISFDTSDVQPSQDWALGTKSQVENIVIAITDGEEWTTDQNTQGETPEWVFTNTGCHSIGSNDHIGFNISNIISSLPDGYTNLYFRYENIPGYWDGQFVVPIHKGPMVFRNQNVGIGITDPACTLDVNGGLIAKSIEIGNNFTATIGCAELMMGYSTRRGVPQRALVDYTKTLMVNYDNAWPNTYIGGKVGIGIISPACTLDVDGDVKINGNTNIINNSNLTVDGKALVGGDVWIGTSLLNYKNSDRLGPTCRATLTFANGGWKNSPSVSNKVSDGDKVVFYNDSVGKVATGLGDNYNLWFQSNGSPKSAIEFWTGSRTKANERMRINSSGNVGIGTQNPTDTLTVNGTASITDRVNIGDSLQGEGVQEGLLTVVRLFDGEGGKHAVITAQSRNVSDLNYDFFVGYHGGARMYRIAANGVAYGPPSDKRLKKDIKTIGSASEKIKNINGVSFTRVDDPDNEIQLGLIAQELEKEFPELVTTNEEDGYKMVNYNGMIPVLLEAIKEQDQRFSAALKKKDQQIAELTADIHKIQETLKTLL